MCAARNDPPLIHNINAIRMANALQTMCDKNARGTNALQHIGNNLFRLFIQRTRGLIEQQQVRLSKKRPCDTDSLRLPARQVSFLSHDCALYAPMLIYKLFQMHQLQHFPDLRLINFPSTNQIFLDRAVEKEGLLRYIADVLVQPI